MRRFLNFFANIYRHRDMIRVMAGRELTSRYVGTLGGALWAIIQPLAIVATFWFVFSVGFKAKGPGNMPFIAYFLAGFIPWLTFNEVLSSSINAITGNAHLVKNIVFPSEVLPLVYLAASAITHGVLVAILIVVTATYGYELSLNALQLLYYFMAMCFLLLGLSWLLSALHVFYRDVGHIVGVMLNLWFWLTPIVWTLELIPEPYRWVIGLNPIFYIVEGYRDALVYAQPFWSNPAGGIYYWSVALTCFGLGAYIFRRLKPEFADVL